MTDEEKEIIVMFCNSLYRSCLKYDIPMDKWSNMSRELQIAWISFCKIKHIKENNND